MTSGPWRAGPVWAPDPELVRMRVNDQTVEMTRDDHGWWHPPEPLLPGTDYAYLLDDDDTPLPDPRSRWQPEGVHGPSRSYDHSAFRWTDGALDGARAARVRAVRAAHRHVHARRDVRRGHRAARPPGRPRRRPGRGDAGQRVRRHRQLGLRRGALVRGARALRRPGRVQAVRRRLPRPRPRRGAGRRLQPHRPVRCVPVPLRPVLRRLEPVGGRAQPRRPRLRRGPPLRDRQRRDLAARLPRGRAAARRGARDRGPSGAAAARGAGRRGRRAGRRGAAGRSA